MPDEHQSEEETEPPSFVIQIHRPGQAVALIRCHIGWHGNSVDWNPGGRNRSGRAMKTTATRSKLVEVARLNSQTRRRGGFLRQTFSLLHQAFRRISLSLPAHRAMINCAPPRAVRRIVGREGNLRATELISRRGSRKFNKAAANFSPCFVHARLIVGVVFVGKRTAVSSARVLEPAALKMTNKRRALN